MERADTSKNNRVAEAVVEQVADDKPEDDAAHCSSEADKPGDRTDYDDPFLFNTTIHPLP